MNYKAIVSQLETLAHRLNQEAGNTDYSGQVRARVNLEIDVLLDVEAEVPDGHIKVTTVSADEDNLEVTISGGVDRYTIEEALKDKLQDDLDNESIDPSTIIRERLEVHICDWDILAVEDYFQV